ncbi:MAG: phosphate ABC transporter substrate-binding protein [Methanospirillaceae archaeon]|nr:phosphate ABC transporter substrate-binding protein [Methanospirillaceae archaeon]
MKRQMIKTGFAGLIIVLCIAVLLSGCTGTPGEGDVTKAERTGTIESLKISGSTTVLPVAANAAEIFMDMHPNADIQVSAGGSSVGVQAVGEGTADIGMASRDLKDVEIEKYPDLVPRMIARDGIAVIVHPSNTVDSLTIDQVKAIYRGEVTNWKDLGGSDTQIVVIGRDSASGTREFFHEFVMKKEDFVQTQLEKNSNGAVKSTIAQTPGSIGYVGLGYIDETIKPVSIDNGTTTIEPTVENVISGEYPVSRSLYMITKGEPTGLAAQFLAYIMSQEGQELVSEEGFVPA